MGVRMVTLLHVLVGAVPSVSTYHLKGMTTNKTAGYIDTVLFSMSLYAYPNMVCTSWYKQTIQFLYILDLVRRASRAKPGKYAQPLLTAHHRLLAQCVYAGGGGKC